MSGDSSTRLNVSLEPHLLSALQPLPDLLPTSLADELRPYVTGISKDTIPYSTLLAISQWSRSPNGKEALTAHTPPFNVNSYSMISLLAGAKTSPERNFGAYKPPPEPEQVAAQKARERKEITAILNALLSIFGVGFSVWWAADKLHWKDQWRVLLSLSSSLVVAMAEGGLYVIWRSRQGTSDPHHKSRRKAIAARHKKFDDSEPNETQMIAEPRPLTGEPPTPPDSNLRQRKP